MNTITGTYGKYIQIYIYKISFLSPGLAPVAFDF